jgi:hypothetical protein
MTQKARVRLQRPITSSSITARISLESEKTVKVSSDDTLAELIKVLRAMPRPEGTPEPTEEELHERAQRLRESLAAFMPQAQLSRGHVLSPILLSGYAGRNDLERAIVMLGVGNPAWSRTPWDLKFQTAQDFLLANRGRVL